MNRFNVKAALFCLITAQAALAGNPALTSQVFIEEKKKSALPCYIITAFGALIASTGLNTFMEQDSLNSTDKFSAGFTTLFGTFIASIGALGANTIRREQLSKPKKLILDSHGITLNHIFYSWSSIEDCVLIDRYYTKQTRISSDEEYGWAPQQNHYYEIALTLVDGTIKMFTTYKFGIETHKFYLLIKHYMKNSAPQSE